MKKEPLIDYTNLSPHERFQLTIKAMARRDKIVLGRLRSAHSAKSPKYVSRLRVSLDLVNSIVIQLAKVEACQQLVNGQIMAVLELVPTFVDAGWGKSSSCPEHLPEIESERERFIDDATRQLDDFVAQTIGPSWLAFRSVCQKDMGLEPGVVILSWIPGVAELLDSLAPILNGLAPEDIDRELEAGMRALWRSAID